MSEFFFMLGNGRVPDDVYERADKIARVHGATLVRYFGPEKVHRYWFSGPNLGEPFDRNLAARVSQSILDAGILWFHQPPDPRWESPPRCSMITMEED